MPLMLEQPYHECETPQWETSGTIVFEDGEAVFKYDCTSRELSSAYSYHSSSMVGEASRPCGATERVALTADDSVSEKALEAIEAIGHDRDEAIELERVDPPTPDDRTGLLVVTTGRHKAVYR